MNTVKGVKGFTPVPLTERFLEKVNKNAQNSCWEWKGSSDGKYGQIWVNGRLCKAHRVSHELYLGEIPEGILVCHKCDNMLCVNPKHLFLGTQSDNMQDCSNKGRITAKKCPWVLRGVKKKYTAKGEKHSQAKLKEYQVVQMRKLFKDGISIKSIASIYKISPSHVGKIIRFKYWTHLQDKALAAINKALGGREE